jgi:hypothetical protein
MVWELAVREFATWRGTIRVSRLASKVLSRYTLKWLESIGCGFSDPPRETWLERLFRRPESTQVTLRYLLLVDFLGTAVESILCTDSPRPFGNALWPCLNKASAHFGQLTVPTCEITTTRNGRFARPDVREALIYSFERSPEQVREYLEENFKLAELDGAGDQFAAPELQPAHSDSPPNLIEPPRADVPTETISDGEIAEAIEPRPDAPIFAEPVSEFDPVPNGAHGSTSRSPGIPRAAQPTLIELFARLSGFRKDGTDRFFHQDGSWINKSSGTIFPWERHNPCGEIARYYLTENQCLEEEPLELKAEVWGLLDQRPELYALILKGPDASPVEVTGASLRAMRESGEITLHPARYRVVHESMALWQKGKTS